MRMTLYRWHGDINTIARALEDNLGLISVSATKVLRDLRETAKHNIPCTHCGHESSQNHSRWCRHNPRAVQLRIMLGKLRSEALGRTGPVPAPPGPGRKSRIDRLDLTEDATATTLVARLEDTCDLFLREQPDYRAWRVTLKARKSLKHPLWRNTETALAHHHEHHGTVYHQVLSASAKSLHPNPRTSFTNIPNRMTVLCHTHIEIQICCPLITSLTIIFRYHDLVLPDMFQTTTPREILTAVAAEWKAPASQNHHQWTQEICNGLDIESDHGTSRAKQLNCTRTGGATPNSIRVRKMLRNAATILRDSAHDLRPEFDPEADEPPSTMHVLRTIGGRVWHELMRWIRHALLNRIPVDPQQMIPTESGLLIPHSSIPSCPEERSTLLRDIALELRTDHGAQPTLILHSDRPEIIQEPIPDPMMEVPAPTYTCNGPPPPLHGAAALVQTRGTGWLTDLFATTAGINGNTAEQKFVGTMGTFRLRSLAEAHRAPEHADFPREAYAAVHHYVSQTDEDSTNWRGLRFNHPALDVYLRDHLGGNTRIATAAAAPLGTRATTTRRQHFTNVYDHECWLANDTMPWADEVWPNVTHVRTTTTTLRAATEETPLSAVIGVAATAPSLRRTAITLLGEVALKQNTRGILPL